MIVKFNKINDNFERELENKKGKRLTDYIGQIGTVIHKMPVNGYENSNSLFGVKFQDGQVWCLEFNQFEVIS